MKNRGQFFLLSAVIIAVVVLSLGVTVNRAIVEKEPSGFYDFSYEVEREVGAVMDYEVYTNIEGGELGEFVDLLAEEIEETNPDSDFFFIYSDEDSVTLRNYGSEVVAEGEEVPDIDEEVKNKICIRNSCKDIISRLEEFVGDFSEYVLDRQSMDEDIRLVIDGSDFNLPLSKHRQVVFVMQKEVDDEKFVSFK